MQSKKLFFLFILSLLYLSISAQTFNCEWINPLPQGNRLNSTYFFDPNTGIVVGDVGTIMLTKNGGTSWKKIDAKTSENLYQIIFIDRNTGFIIGDNGALFLTRNGGINWLPKDLGTKDKLVGIHFINAKVGFVLAERNILFKTVDGGNNWTQIQLPSRNRFVGMDFSSSNKAVIAAQRYELLISTNAGNSWTSIDLKSNPNAAIQRAYFSDVKIVDNDIILSSQKNLFISSNNGKQWINHVACSKSGYIQSMTFVHRNLSFLTDNYGNLLKSTTEFKDYQLKLGKEQKTKLRDIFMLNSMIGFAVGEAGRVLVTKNGGEKWSLLTSGSIENFKDIEYIDQNIGYILTDYGKLYKTRDAGRNLTIVKESILSGGFTNSFHDLHFLDQNVGFASSSMGYLCTTRDGGYNWTKMKVPENKLSRFEFVNSTTGYIGSAKGIIYKTTDGGKTWNPMQTGHSGNILAINFASPNVGYAASEKGIALKTTDGGRTWTTIQTILKNSLLAVHAVNESTVMFTTTGNYTRMADAEIIRSTDGGASWTKITIPPYTVYKFDFLNDKIGAALCSGGVLATTNNGGQNWQINKSISNAIIWGIHWQNPGEIVAVGTSGAILRYTTGKIVASDNTKKTDVVVKKPEKLKRTLNGIPIEFTSIDSVSKTKTGVLKKDIKINVGTNVIPIAAGTTVNYDSAKAVITRAKIKDDLKIDVKGGSILVKGNTFIDMNKDYVLNAVMKEDAVLELEAGAIPVKAMPTGVKPNIVFTTRGDLSYAYLSADFDAQFDEQTLKIPAGSKLSFSSGRISGVNLTQNMKIKLGSYEFEVVGQLAANVTSFNVSPSSGVFSSIKVTPGHTVHVNDTDIPVQGGSYIVLTKQTGIYEVRKFRLGQAMIVDIHKKRKTKQRDLKAGKTLVVEGGYVIRTGGF